MLQLVRTDCSNEDFIALIRLLDEDLARPDGKETAFYLQYNTITPNYAPYVGVENSICFGKFL